MYGSARLLFVGVLDTEDLRRTAVVEWQHEVLLSLLRTMA